MVNRNKFSGTVFCISSPPILGGGGGGKSVSMESLPPVVGVPAISVRKVAKAMPAKALHTIITYRTTSPLLLSQGGEPIQIRRSCNLPSFFKEGLGVVACGRKVCDSVISRLQNLPDTYGVPTKPQPHRRKSISFIALIGLCLLLHSCSNSGKGGLSASGPAAFADSAVSTVRLYKDGQGREVLQKNNTYYDLVDFIDKSDLKKMMIKITKAETSFIDSDASKSHFIVSVTNIADPKATWTKELSGSDIDYSSKVIVVHSEGRNANEEDTYTQYSLLTGEKLMTYTYGQLTTLIPNTSNKRFFGYLSKESATEDKPEGFAVVSYVGSNEVIDKVSIKLKGGAEIPVYTPELKMMVVKESGNTIANEGKTVIMGHADRGFTAKDINNFAMQINYYLPNVADPVTILLPVREDRLDIANASYDKTIFELSKAN